MIKQVISMGDVGVLLVGYNRPDLLTNRIHELASANLVNLYISIDGGELSRTTEMENFKILVKNKLAFIPNLRINHESHNLGMVRHLTSKITQVLSNHNYIIVIEDDVRLSKAFFPNMLNGLNYLENRKLVGVVCGWSPLPIPYIKNKWRNSKYVYLWGWATSKYAWEGYSYDLSKENLEKNLAKSLRWSKLSNHQRASWLSKFKTIKELPLNTWDYQYLYHCIKSNHHIIAPLFSITGNQGFEDERAVHTKGIKPRFIQNKLLNNRKITQTSRFFTLIVYFFDLIYLNDSIFVSKLKSFLNKIKRL